MTKLQDNCQHQWSDGRLNTIVSCKLCGMIQPDRHTAKAAELFNVKPEDVTPEQRRVGKTVNFGQIYGMTQNGVIHRMRNPTRKEQRDIEKAITGED